MSVELFPSRDPLRRLGSMSLITGLLGLLAIIYSMVNFVRGRNGSEEWMLGVGCCLLFGAVAASLVQGVLLGHRTRIEASGEARGRRREPPGGRDSVMSRSGALAVVLVLCGGSYPGPRHPDLRVSFLE